MCNSKLLLHTDCMSKLNRRNAAKKKLKATMITSNIKITQTATYFADK
jgi:hypothetical protein